MLVGRNAFMYTGTTVPPTSALSSLEVSCFDRRLEAMPLLIVVTALLFTGIDFNRGNCNDSGLGTNKLLICKGVLGTMGGWVEWLSMEGSLVVVVESSALDVNIFAFALKSLDRCRVVLCERLLSRDGI